MNCVKTKNIYMRRISKHNTTHVSYIKTQAYTGAVYQNKTNKLVLRLKREYIAKSGYLEDLLELNISVDRFILQSSRLSYKI